MILGKILNSHLCYAKYTQNSVNVCLTHFSPRSVKRYSCLSNGAYNKQNRNYENSHFPSIQFTVQKYNFSNDLLNGDTTELHSKVTENELNTIAKLFPNPRVTLNELSTKVPNKVFDLLYKQNVSPKGGRKKNKIVQEKDWTCTYSFVWPKKMKFESTAISKKQAAEKSANQALHWLYFNQRINKRGLPIYDRDKIEELRTTLNEPLTASLSPNSVERLTRIWNDYENEIKEIYDKTHEKAMRRIVAKPVTPTKDSTIDQDDEHSACDDENAAETDNSEYVKVHPVYGKSITRPTKQELDRRQMALNRSLQHYREELTPLPIDDYADKITSTLSTNRVAVIIGAAGCGKSTRAPAAILQHGGADVTAIVSEPRRVAAIGLAQRVATELGEEVGKTIGYQVRFRSKPPLPPGGSILYCTSGVLLRRLQVNPGLEGCTHVFIDEAHERDVNTDITLLLLKRAVTLNEQLRVVIMSATLDAGVFTKYFDNCPIVEVPGRTYPVEITYLEDFNKKLGRVDVTKTMESCTKDYGKLNIHINEIVNVIKAIDKTESEGAILVFLPGWSEIKAVTQRLNEFYGHSGTHIVIPVHSRLTPEDQSRMFTTALPGVRKIVVATNIAETSITIPDVVYVIDCGLHKENRMREGTGTTTLQTAYISKAASTQRAGRAGRVRAGNCYRMYTRDLEQGFEDHSAPEILRVPLEQTVLDCKSYAPDVKIANFLAELPEPPTKEAVEFAIKDMVDLGALTPTEHLTPLGTTLSSFPMQARLTTALIHAAAVGTSLATADIVTHDSVRVFSELPSEIRELKQKHSSTSDHMAMHRIQADFEQELDDRGWTGVNRWCETNKLSKEQLNYARVLSSHYLECLFKSNLIPRNVDLQELNRLSNNEAMTSAALLSGCNDLIVVKKQIKVKGKLGTVMRAFTSLGDRAHIGSESVNHPPPHPPPSPPTLLAHSGGRHCAQRRALLVYQTSQVPAIVAIWFSRGVLLQDHDIKNNNADTSVLYLPRHNLRVQVPASQADLFIKTKEMIWSTFQYFYERDISNIDPDDTLTRYRIRLFKAIAKVLDTDKKEDSNTSDNCEDEDFR